MVLDTSSGDLSPNIYRERVIPQIQKLVQAFPQKLGYYSKAHDLGTH